MKYNKPFFGLFLAALVLLPGCMHVPTYRSKSFKSMDVNFTNHEVKKDIILKTKKLSTPEVQYLFGCSHKQLLNDITVIYFSIHNLSNIDYCIAPENITLTSLTFDNVTKFIKQTNTAFRFAGAAVSGFIGSPLLFNSWIWCIGTTDLPGVVVLPFIGAAVIAIPLGIIFLAEGIKSAVINRRIKKDIKNKMLHKKIIIKSGQHYEGLVFVKSSDYKPTFTVTMHEKKNIKNNAIFNVNVHA